MIDELAELAELGQPRTGRSGRRVVVSELPYAVGRATVEIDRDAVEIDQHDGDLDALTTPLTTPGGSLRAGRHT